jgi:hypothetical protein
MNTMPSPAAMVGTGNYETARFNALRHGVLSRYTVLPWEDETEYRALLGALVAEHAPEGPTEEHLVEELAGIIWRKRRLRMAEAAVYREKLRHDASGYRTSVTAHEGVVGSSLVLALFVAALAIGEVRPAVAEYLWFAGFAEPLVTPQLVRWLYAV